MRKGKMILWQERPEEENITEQSPLVQLLLQTVMTIGISLLFVYSAVSMIESIFTKYYLSGKDIAILIGAISAIVISQIVIAHMENRRMRVLAKLGLVLLMALIFCVFYHSNRTDIEDGALWIVSDYIKRWNSYYKVNILFADGVKNLAVYSYTVYIVAIAIGLQIISGISRKEWIVGLLPAVAIISELLIGYAPDWKGLMFLFVAVALCFSKAWKRRESMKQLMVLIIMTGIILFVISLAFRGSAEWIASKEDSVLTFQRNLEVGLNNLSWQNTNFQSGKIDNHKPKYDQKEVMSLEVSVVPDENIYLRGFYGGNYSAGGWSDDSAEFEKACESNGITEEKAAELLSGMYKSFDDTLYEITGSNPQLLYTLNYTNIRDAYMYSPYLVDPETASEDISFTGDYDIRKDKKLESVTISGDVSNTYPALVTNGYGFDMLSDNWLTDEQSEFSYWYNDYVKLHYMDVPNGQNGARKLVAQLELDDNVTYYESMATTSVPVDVNYARYALADYVSKELRKQYRYNLVLDEIDGSTDPIEYFLAESHRGYCVHFASAGVFMLRKMGVPARYCSGYVVKHDEFEKNGMTFDQIVKDSAAHAWCEIYLDDYGWVPIEMTPGFGAGSYMASYTDATDANDIEGDITAESSEQSSEPDSEVSSEENTQSTSNQGDSENPSQGQSTNQANNSTGSGKENSGWGFFGNGGLAIFGHDGTIRIGNLLIGIGGITVIVLGIMILVYQLVKKKRNVQINLARQIRKKEYQSALQQMNHLIYRKMRKSKKVKRSECRDMSDAKYQELLMEQFPEVGEDWIRYMNIVKKAAFSNDEFSEEEVQFVYRIYKSI